MYILFERLEFSQLLQIDDVAALKKPCKKHEWSEDSPVRCQQGVEGRDSLGEVNFVEVDFVMPDRDDFNSNLDDTCGNCERRMPSSLFIPNKISTLLFTLILQCENLPTIYYSFAYLCMILTIFNQKSWILK